MRARQHKDKLQELKDLATGKISLSDLREAKAYIVHEKENVYTVQGKVLSAPDYATWRAGLLPQDIVILIHRPAGNYVEVKPFIPPAAPERKAEEVKPPADNIEWEMVKEPQQTTTWKRLSEHASFNDRITDRIF